MANLSSNPMSRVTAVGITRHDGAELQSPALAVIVHVPDMESAKAVRDYISRLVTSPRETPAPQSEVSADLSELKRLAGHYGGYAEKIMRAAAIEIEQRRVEVEKYKAWAASCDPCFEYPPDATPTPDAKPDAWMSSINPNLVTSDESEVLCWNNPPIALYRRAEKSNEQSTSPAGSPSRPKEPDSSPDSPAGDVPNDHYCLHGFSIQRSCYFCGRFTEPGRIDAEQFPEGR